MRLRWCTKTPPKGALKPKPVYKAPTPSYLPPSSRSSSPNSRIQGGSSTTTGSPNLQNFAASISPSTFTTVRPAIQFQRRSHQDAYETKFKPILLNENEKKFKPILLKSEAIEEKTPQHILIEDFFVQNSAEDLELITKSHAEPLLSHNTEPSKASNEFMKKAAVTTKAMDKGHTFYEDREVPGSNPVLGNNDEENAPENTMSNISLLDKLRQITPSEKPSISKMPPIPVSISDELSGFDNYASGIYESSHIGETAL